MYHSDKKQIDYQLQGVLLKKGDDITLSPLGLELSIRLLCTLCSLDLIGIDQRLGPIELIALIAKPDSRERYPPVTCRGLVELNFMFIKKLANIFRFIFGYTA